MTPTTFSTTVRAMLAQDAKCARELIGQPMTTKPYDKAYSPQIGGIAFHTDDAATRERLMNDAVTAPPAPLAQVAANLIRGEALMIVTEETISFRNSILRALIADAVKNGTLIKFDTCTPANQVMVARMVAEESRAFHLAEAGRAEQSIKDLDSGLVRETKPA